MALLKHLFQNQQAGFTVYSPDCAQSRLWGNLDHAIHEATGFQVAYRQWINHDVNSIVRFYAAPGEPTPPEQNPEEAARKYDNVPIENLQYGHLVVKLFLLGPALLTIWQGQNVIETLSVLKGSTHPSEAAPHSIRGGFWCDNSVCNLIHVSDNVSEAERELQALHLRHLLDNEVGSCDLIAPIPAPKHYIAHSAISVVSDVINRMLIAINPAEKLIFELPVSGSSQETQQLLTPLLQQTAQKFPQTLIAAFIESYLAGDVITTTRLLKQLPITHWEYFIIQCGTMTRYKWNG